MTIILRTKEEMKEAHQNLADAFHPRKNYGDCDICNNNEYHSWPCTMGCTSFQGWETNVMTTLGLSPQCVKNECDKVPYKRVYVNIWGCLCEYDLCFYHADGVHMTYRDCI